MEAQKIAEQIKDRYPAEVKDIKEFRGQVALVIRKDGAKEILRYLHETPELAFDYLADLCGVDYLDKKEPRFEVVYHLYSIKHRGLLRVRVEVPEEDCSVDSVTDIWAGANWHERECYDLFGVTFKGHPDLRRVLLPEDWEGYPLRKDYPLKSDLGEQEWKGFRELLETSRKNSAYDTR